MQDTRTLFPFISTISTWNFSNFLGTCEPSCLLHHEFHFVIRSSSLQTPATHRTINAMHSRVADKGLNLRYFPARGIFRMFMNEVLLHCHLQLVSLIHKFLSVARFSLFSTCWFLVSPHTKLSLGGLPARSSGCSRFCTRRSSALSSSRLKSQIVELAVAVIKSTANSSRSPNLVAHDANLDGSSIAVHAFNSFESMHNSMISSSLRSSTIQSGLSDSSIFSNTSVLLCAMLFICSGAASAASPTMSSTLHVFWAGTSTSTSRCCSSAFAASSSTSSPCLFWPRLSVNLTRFVSRSSVFVSFALEPDPARGPELDDTTTKGVG